MATYENPIEPMTGKLTSNTDRHEKLEPPPTIKLAGWLRKKRIRSFQKTEKGNTHVRLTKKGLSSVTPFAILVDTIELNALARTQVTHSTHNLA